MAVRQILKAGNPVLRKKSADITEDEVFTKDFKKLLKDMFDTMRHYDGVGLAAPQIGILKNLVVIGHGKNERYPDEDSLPDQVIINPVIRPVATDVAGMWEGCLSVPGMRGYVERPSAIEMEWYNEKFEKQKDVFSDFRAIVYQHECDHLNGILYIDELKSTSMFGFNEELNL